MSNESRTVIKNIEKCIKVFRDYSGDGLNQFVDKTDNSLTFPRELSNVVEEFIEALKNISNVVENSEFVSELYNDAEEDFWDIVKEFVENRISAKNELLFIKKINGDDFNDLFYYVFNSYVLEYNELKAYKSYDEENIIVIIKVINTLVKMIIEGLYSKAVFENKASDLFGLSNEQLNYIWDLINENKTDLRYISLIRQLKNLEN